MYETIVSIKNAKKRQLAFFTICNLMGVARVRRRG
jgi:hypothetical protein